MIILTQQKKFFLKMEDIEMEKYIIDVNAMTIAYTENDVEVWRDSIKDVEDLEQTLTHLYDFNCFIEVCEGVI